MTKKKTWEEFRRMRMEPFFGCLDSDGDWFDSSQTFEIAVHWCACHLGEHSLDKEQELELMNNHGMSVVHSSMLKQMYEKGLIK